MGVGKYNLPGGQYFPVADLGASVPTSQWGGEIPAGISANPFDQSNINWNMALKYSQDYTKSNQDIANLYNQGRQQGYYDPNGPAYYETDPTKLFQFFNSGQVGIPTSRGVMSQYDMSKGGMDPLQMMLNGNGFGVPMQYQGQGDVTGNSSTLQSQFGGFGNTPAMGPFPTNANGAIPGDAALRAQFGGFGGREFVGPLQQAPAGVPSNGVPWVAPAAQAQFGGLGGTPASRMTVNQQGQSVAQGVPSWLSSLINQVQPGTSSTSGTATSQSNWGYQQPTAAQTDIESWLSGLRNQVGQLQSLATNTPGIDMNTNDIGWLRNFVQGGGQRFDAQPVWQQMVAAQQDSVNRNANDLNEYFNTMGGRFSTSFGDAMGDYYAQTTKDQNALLGQMQMMASEAAANRMASGGGQLASMSQAAQADRLARQLNAASQLAGYGFAGPQAAAGLMNQRLLQGNQLGLQDTMQQRDILAQFGLQGRSHQNALDMQNNNFGFNAAMYNAQAADAAANALNQNAMYAGNQLLNNSIAGTMGLYGTANNAANNLFGGQQQGLASALQNSLAGMGLNLNAAGNVNSFLNNLIGQGMGLSGLQNSTLSQQMNTAYQEWLRTQPQYNPLMQLLAGLSGQGSNMYFPQFQPSMFQQVMGAMGGGGGLASILKLFGIG